MMNEMWDKLGEQLGKRIADTVFALLENHLNKYFKGEMRIVFSEAEAAEKLHISKSTLERIRANDEINYSYINRSQFTRQPI